MQEPSGVSSIFDEKAYLSALDWWRLAGVDEAIVEDPVNWLAPAARPSEQAGAAIKGSGATAPVEKPVEPLPATLAEFRQWLIASDGLPEAVPKGSRLPLDGPDQADFVVMVDMAEGDDRQSGRLFSGQAGALLDAMLRAIGRSRDNIALIPLVPGRTPTGKPAEQALGRWGEIGRHHIALLKPKRALLMGEAVSRAILGANLAEMRGELRPVNHDTATFGAVATFDTRFLLRQPARKKDAWRDLLLFAKDI